MKSLRALFIVTVVLFMLGTNFASAQNSSVGKVSKLPAASLKKMEKAATALSKDKEFKELLVLGGSALKKAETSIKKLSKKQRRKFKRQLKLSLKKLRSSKNISKAKISPKLLKQIGIDQKLMQKAYALGKKLRERHPLITSVSGVGQAGMSNLYVMEYGLYNIDPNYCETVDCDCFSACTEEYRQAYNAAGFDWYFGAITDFPNPFSAFTGYFKMISKIADLQEQLVDCQARCNGLGENWECQADTDCDPDEFCKNPIGNPVNNCTTKRPEGWACSRHGKCQSGCCKYHISNPLQMICRPANKCN
jgi:Dickkopf-like protein